MSTTGSQETIVLGHEYDDKLRLTLVQLLRELGATGLEETWGLAGSQEISSAKAQLGGKPLLIEAETYIGLSITGDPNLVRQIAATVRERLHRP
jgi:hypothetical protein